MTNVFNDQQRFMQACDQTVDHYNAAQYQLYKDLIQEELQELEDAETPVDMLDALTDILVVTIGAIHSMGADAQGAWDEVMRTNFAKIDPDTGKVRTRADGKVLKPQGWVAPNLEAYVKK